MRVSPGGKSPYAAVLAALAVLGVSACDDAMPMETSLETSEAYESLLPTEEVVVMPEDMDPLRALQRASIRMKQLDRRRPASVVRQEMANLRQEAAFLTWLAERGSATEVTTSSWQDEFKFTAYPFSFLYLTSTFDAYLAVGAAVNKPARWSINVFTHASGTYGGSWYTNLSSYLNTDAFYHNHKHNRHCYPQSVWDSQATWNVTASVTGATLLERTDNTATCFAPPQYA